MSKNHISNKKIKKILEAKKYYYHSTTYAGWMNTLNTKEGSADKLKQQERQKYIMDQLGYNIFLSKDEANKCLEEINKIYEKYKEK